MVHIVPHTTDLGISDLSAANILAVIGGISIIGRIGTGILGDKLGIRKAYVVGFIVMATSFFWLVTVEDKWLFYLYTVIFGIFSNTGVLGPSLVTEYFGLKAHGIIFGIMDFVFSIGSAVGPLFAGYIFDITSSYTTAFLICGTLGIAGVILDSLLRPIQKKDR